MPSGSYNFFLIIFNMPFLKLFKVLMRLAPSVSNYFSRKLQQRHSNSSGYSHTLSNIWSLLDPHGRRDNSVTYPSLNLNTTVFLSQQAFFLSHICNLVKRITNKLNQEALPAFLPLFYYLSRKIEEEEEG